MMKPGVLLAAVSIVETRRGANVDDPDHGTRLVDGGPCMTPARPSPWSAARRGHRDGSGEAGPPVTQEPDRGLVRATPSWLGRRRSLTSLPSSSTRTS